MPFGRLPVDLSATTLETRHGQLTSECDNAKIRVERFDDDDTFLMTLNTDDGSTQAFFDREAAWAFYSRLEKLLEIDTIDMR